MRTVLRSLSLRWRLAVVAAVAAVALVVGVLLVQAELVPRTFAYQGVLTDAAGTPLTGDHSITMRVYVDGSTATALCTEVEVVTVTNGLFRMVVGDGGCSVDPDWFTLTAPVYLGITVDTTTLAPRVPLFPVAAAYQAEHAESADRHVVQYGTEVISIGGVYCGSTVSRTGNMGGYAGAKALCETACGDPAAHVCTDDDVLRSLQLGIAMPVDQRYARNQGECEGWWNGTFPSYTMGLTNAAGEPTHICPGGNAGTCDQAAQSLCCL
jgi:hypothetical protein